MVSADEFVVEVDQDAVVWARATLIRMMISPVFASLLGGALLLGLGVILLEFEIAVGLLDLVPAALILLMGVRALRDLRRLRAVWAAHGVPPTAMRISGAGLRVSIDAAPDSVFLPWSCVQGFHLHSRLGQQLLVLDLVPGVTAATPGVSGLEHPDVQHVLRRKVHGTRGLRMAVRMLRQSPAAIDQALAAYTEGQVRIR